MKTAIIKTNNERIVVNFNQNKIYGYKFGNDNSIQPVNNDILKYFDFLRCSSNFTNLNNENDYEVRLDNETGFKHYYKNGLEDLKMFFFNNGEDACLYDDNNNSEKKSEYKKFRFRKICTVIISLEILYNLYLLPTTIAKLSSTPQETPTEYSFEEIKNNLTEKYENDIDHLDNVSLEFIKNRINASSSLTPEEKNYLYNEDFFNDILPYVNQSSWMKYTYDNCFNDITIKNLSDDVEYSIKGRYVENEWNTIYVRDYDFKTDNSKDTLAHEFIHMCQSHFIEYNLIKEACAEIISKEYFPSANYSTYQEPVYLVKKLMEIIGTEPIKQYIFQDDISGLENSIKPYLTDEEYNTIIDCLSFDGQVDNSTKFQTLSILLDKLYERIYNENIISNPILNCLRTEDKKVLRYYFNSKYINKESPYYININNYSLANAFEDGIVKITATIKEPIDEELGRKLKEENDYRLSIFPGYNIIEDLKISVPDTGDKTDILLTGHIGDYYFEKVRNSELIAQGIIKDKLYFMRTEKILTYEEYMSGDYDNCISSYSYSARDKDIVDFLIENKDNHLVANQTDSINSQYSH